jgi:magnesium-transporting ATPase (P-type)
MFQIFYLLHCRSLRDSLFGLGLFGNPWVFLGIGALLALQAAFIYAPPLQAMFGSATLGVGDLLDALLVGAVILPLISIEKRLRRDRARLRG